MSRYINRYDGANFVNSFMRTNGVTHAHNKNEGAPARSLGRFFDLSVRKYYPRRFTRSRTGNDNTTLVPRNARRVRCC